MLIAIFDFPNIGKGRYEFHLGWPVYGLTPLEVLNGAIPDKNLFKENIKKARVRRIEWNRGGCGKC